MRVVLVPLVMEKANLLLTAALKVFLFQLETKSLPPSTTSLILLSSQSSLSPSPLSLPVLSPSQSLSVSLSSALLSSSFSFISVSPPPLSHSVSLSLSLLPQSALLSVWVALLNAAAERIAHSCILPSHRKRTGHVFPFFSPQMDV